MPDVATSLLDFILGLMRNPQAAAAFQAHPEASLQAAGLGSVSAADVHAVLPVALDYAPVSLHSSFDRSYSGALGGGIHAPVTTAASLTPAPVTHTDVAAATASPSASHTGLGSGLGGLGSGHTPSTGVSPAHASSGAVAHLQNIINNYSYTSVDDRTTTLDHSVNQNIYAAGDVTQSFDDHSATATGDGAVAGQSISGPVTTGSNNLVADHSDVGNTDASVNLKDSFDGNGNDSSHHDTTTTTTTDTTNATDNSTNGSYNPVGSFNTKDSFNDASHHDAATTTSAATTNTTTTSDSHALTGVGNDSHAVTGSALDSLNGSGNDSSDHSVDDHTHTTDTDLNAAFSDSHDDNSDHSTTDDSTNTDVDHNLVLDHALPL